MSGGSPVVSHDDHDEEQVNLDGDVEPEEMMDDEGEGEGEEEEEADNGEETGFHAEQDGRAPKVSLEKLSEDNNGKNDCHDQSNDKQENGKDINADYLLSLPPHGSEVFIGSLPREASEEDLRGLCEPFGEIHEIRLMKDERKLENKGYAFVIFTTKESALKAIKGLKDMEWKGRTLRCSQSQDRNRLFIGNVPKSWDKEQLEKSIAENSPGLQSVELLKDPQNEERNRGFAFVEYYNHACAEHARKNMSKRNFKLENRTPTIRWADPKNTPEITEVKAIYVNNLPESVTQEQLKELFKCHGEITRVVLPAPKPGQSKREFGFVHFAERESALKAVEQAEKYELEGNVLEISLARPQSEKNTNEGAYLAQRGSLFPSYQAQMGFGYAGNMYGGALGTGFGAVGGYAQPMIYGRGPTPAGMAMVPMILPDGRIGYVLQQPGTQGAQLAPNRSGRTGYGSRQGSGNSGGRRYRPY